MGLGDGAVLPPITPAMSLESFGKIDVFETPPDRSFLSSETIPYQRAQFLGYTSGDGNEKRRDLAV